MVKLGAWSFCVGTLVFVCTFGVDAATPAGPLTLEAIFSPDPGERIEFGGSPLTGLEWVADGPAFLQPQDQDKNFKPPLKVEVSGDRSGPLFDSARMIGSLTLLDGFPAEDARNLLRQDVRLSPLQDALLIQRASDLYHFSIGDGTAIRLTHDADLEEIARFSPDGSRVAFVRHNDLHVVRVDDGMESPLTHGGGPALLNGKLDWVYQEELYGRGDFKGFWWSPDSRTLAYLQLDESPVPEFTLVDHLPTRSRTEVVRYPKAGDPNPGVRLGIVPVEGGPTVWADTTRYQSADHLIVRVGWTPDSHKVGFLVQDREQTWLDINLADAGSGKVTNLVHETSPAFVDVDLTGQPYWLEDGSFIWASGRTGYHHLYHFGPAGDLLGQITNGEWEVRELYGVDEDAGWVYFAASEHSPIEVHIYRQHLDGSGFQRLSSENGTHGADFDPSFTYYLNTWSDVDTPPQVTLRRADGSRIRTIDNNEVSALEELELASVEFLQVPSPDGFVFEAALIKPVDFDPNKSYPVLQYNYGGPHSQTVRNAWGGSRHMWFRYLAQEGLVVWMCDNRSASAKGIQPTWEAYQRMGELELADLETCLLWLKQKPWIDPSRVAVYGGSYGGFMASFALTHSRIFKAGIAFAPVTDWRLYDSIYTERYMRQPKNNPQGYDATSVIEAAGQLHGEFLLIHGTMDDNVHLQNTIQLADALQQAGKSFQLMLYKSQILHLHHLMTQFLMGEL